MTITHYHVRQHDGYPHACDGRNCAAASGAMAVAYGSGGEHIPTSDQFRERSGASCVPGVHSSSGGLFITDVERTAAKYNVVVNYGRSSTGGLLRRAFSTIKTWCNRRGANNGAVLAGDYDQLPAGIDIVPSFTGDHSVFVHDYDSADDTFCWHDPLAPGPKRVKASVVERYNQKVGSPVKGLAGFVVIPDELPDTGTGDEIVRDFSFIYNTAADLVTAALVVEDAGTQYLDLGDNQLKSIAVGTKKEGVKVRLKQPIIAGKPMTDDWTLGWLIGTDAAFVLDRNVRASVHLDGGGAQDYPVTVNVGGKIVSGTVRLP